MIYTIFNAICTPDETFLHCTHNHDFKMLHDKISGEIYMNDGLGYCIRRSVNKIPYVDLSIDSEHPHEVQRKYFRWGTISLENMANTHIKNILLTQKHIRSTYVFDLLSNELAYREEHNIYIEG